MPNFDEAKKAIEANNAERLKALLALDPTLARQTEEFSNTLLHFAACQRSVECVHALLEAGADVDGPGHDHGTALHWAASLNHVDVCKRLIEAGASLTCSDGLGEGGTPVVQALMYGHREAAELLAEHGIFPNNLRVAAGLGRMDLMCSFFDDNGQVVEAAGRERTWYRPHDEFPERPTTDDPQEVLDEALCYACFNDRREAAEFLLQHGANPNAITHYATALHLATAKEDRALIDLLFDYGADATILDHSYHSTAAGWAEYAGNDELAAYLDRRAAETDLLAAVRCGDLARVNQHLPAVAPDLLQGEWGRCVLAAAILCGHADVARVLRERGARLDLVAAAQLGLVAEVQDLLREGVDPDTTRMVQTPIPCEGSQPRPMSALLMAAINRQRGVCDVLLQAGAQLDPWTAAALGKLDDLRPMLDVGHPVDLEDAIGRTALHRAIQGDAVDVARFLLERGASIEKPADFFSCGSQAIHVAAEAGASQAMLRLLLDCGADINAEKNNGTPLDCAIRCGKAETSQVLRSLGARTAKELKRE